MQINARNEKKQELIPTKSNHQTTGLVSRDGLRLARFKPPLASAESNLSDMTHVKTVKTAKRMMKMVSEQVGASCWIIYDASFVFRLITHRIHVWYIC
jgi:DNA polymerase III sliding clamp (beta) subunit (PCNA family)